MSSGLRYHPVCKCYNCTWSQWHRDVDSVYRLSHFFWPWPASRSINFSRRWNLSVGWPIYQLFIAKTVWYVFIWILTTVLFIFSSCNFFLIVICQSKVVAEMWCALCMTLIDHYYKGDAHRTSSHSSAYEIIKFDIKEMSVLSGSVMFLLANCSPTVCITAILFVLWLNESATFEGDIANAITRQNSMAGALHQMQAYAHF